MTKEPVSQTAEMKVQHPIPCPTCRAPIFVRENGNIIAHYDGDGIRCKANETPMPCDCWKYEQQVCDVCQKVEGASEAQPVAAIKSFPATETTRPYEEAICEYCNVPIWRCTDEPGIRMGWMHRAVPSNPCSRKATPYTYATPKVEAQREEEPPCEWYGRNVGPHSWIHLPRYGIKRCRNCKNEIPLISARTPSDMPEPLVSDEMIAHLQNDEVNSVADMAREASLKGVK